ncbi:MAG: YlxR family protein [Desulfobulbaceae bacterium]|nr:MAG: YlxR family protein [Desulfobulbaceae bacterium]
MAGAREPIRSCAACGRKRPKKELRRFVWGSDQPLADPDGRFDGRGAYCCNDQSCYDRFLNRKKKWKRLFRL